MGAVDVNVNVNLDVSVMNVSSANVAVRWRCSALQVCLVRLVLCNTRLQKVKVLTVISNLFQ